MQALNPSYLLGLDAADGLMATAPGITMFIAAAAFASMVLGAVKIERQAKRVTYGYRRTFFGWIIKLIAGNLIMPLVSIAGVIGFSMAVFSYFGENNLGVEFFASEPEQAIVMSRHAETYRCMKKTNWCAKPKKLFCSIRASHLSLPLRCGGTKPEHRRGQRAQGYNRTNQLETVPWEDRKDRPELDGDIVIDELSAALQEIPGIQIEVLNWAAACNGKTQHLRLKGDNWEDLLATTADMRAS